MVLKKSFTYFVRTDYRKGNLVFTTKRTRAQDEYLPIYLIYDTSWVLYEIINLIQVGE